MIPLKTSFCGPGILPRCSKFKKLIARSVRSMSRLTIEWIKIDKQHNRKMNGDNQRRVSARLDNN